MATITIYVWAFVGLIVTNIFTALLLVGLINLVCYLHDMIKVSVDMRREEKRAKNNSNRH